jgi:hypothetical protein
MIKIDEQLLEDTIDALTSSLERIYEYHTQHSCTNRSSWSQDERLEYVSTHCFGILQQLMGLRNEQS